VVAQHQGVDGVVVQLADGGEEKAVGVMRNVENLLGALGPDWSIELVAHGHGLSALCADSAVSDQVRGAIARGVRFAACANTMQREGVTREALLAGVDVVDSGLAHLAVRQREGWSYVRP
jgi:uncharacterized protein